MGDKDKVMTTVNLQLTTRDITRRDEETSVKAHHAISKESSNEILLESHEFPLLAIVNYNEETIRTVSLVNEHHKTFASDVSEDSLDRISGAVRVSLSIGRTISLESLPRRCSSGSDAWLKWHAGASLVATDVKWFKGRVHSRILPDGFPRIEALFERGWYRENEGTETSPSSASSLDSGTNRCIHKSPQSYFSKSSVVMKSRNLVNPMDVMT